MRILLIDDEPVALTKMEMMLRETGDCDKAATGIEATGLFVKAIGENRPYDLVTIDIELPDITGLDLLSRFCQLETENQTPPAKKVMVTAHSKVNYVIKAREQCDAFLVKPIRKDALLAKVTELLPVQSSR